MRTPRGFYNDDPAWPLVLTEISYWGVTSAAGAVTGTTVVCADLANEPSYQGLAVKLLDGAAAGQVRVIDVHVAGTNTLIVPNPFTDNAGAVVQVTASTRFVIMSAGGAGGAPAPPVAPSIGLWMFGLCDPGMAASPNTLVMPNLAGFPDDIFNTEFWIQVIHNFLNPGVAPEREIRRVTNYVGATGTFTVDAFSANVRANDLVCVFHESIMSIEILGYGTLTTNSVIVPADAGRAALYPWENDEYFRGCILQPTEGNCRFQPRPIRHYVAATGVFTLAEPFSQLPGLVDYVIIGFAYPADIHEKIDLILDLVNAIFRLQETGGSLTADGTEQNVYLNNDPMGVFAPKKIKVDMTNMDWGDTTVLRWYERIASGGSLLKKDEMTFSDPQDPALKNIELEPNRFGFRVTLQQTAGVNRIYAWEYLYES